MVAGESPVGLDVANVPTPFIDRSAWQRAIAAPAGPHTFCGCAAAFEGVALALNATTKVANAMSASARKGNDTLTGPFLLRARADLGPEGIDSGRAGRIVDGLFCVLGGTFVSGPARQPGGRFTRATEVVHGEVRVLWARQDQRQVTPAAPVRLERPPEQRVAR